MMLTQPQCKLIQRFLWTQCWVYSSSVQSLLPASPCLDDRNTVSLISAKAQCSRQTDLPGKLLAKHLVDILKIPPFKCASTVDTHFSHEEKCAVCSSSYSCPRDMKPVPKRPLALPIILETSCLHMITSGLKS